MRAQDAMVCGAPWMEKSGWNRLEKGNSYWGGGTLVSTETSTELNFNPAFPSTSTLDFFRFPDELEGEKFAIPITDVKTIS